MLRTCDYYPNYPNSYTSSKTMLALQIAFSLLLANIILLSCFNSEACCTDYPTTILSACCKSYTTYSYSSTSDSAALVSF